MNILVEGYLDRNFGDDMMIRVVAHQLSECNLFIKECKKELLLPFSGHDNLHDWDNHKDTKVDLILRVLGSGFMITSKFGLYYCALNILNNRTLHRRQIPAAVIGCNVGPFRNRFAAWLSRMEMKQYDLFTVRDRFSFDFISNKLKKKDVFYYPDILFSIPQEWIPPHTGEQCLGISAYRMQNKSNLEYYRKMAEIADAFIEQNNQKVLLFAFDVERENDLAAAFTIRGLCKNKEMVEIVAHDDDGTNIMNGMARCAHVISVRLHSCILALRMGIAFTPIIYSQKTDFVLDGLGYRQPRFYIDHFCASDVLQALQTTQAFVVDPSVFEQAKQHANTIKQTFLKER